MYGSQFGSRSRSAGGDYRRRIVSGIGFRQKRAVKLPLRAIAWDEDRSADVVCGSTLFRAVIVIAVTAKDRQALDTRASSARRQITATAIPVFRISSHPALTRRRRS